MAYKYIVFEVANGEIKRELPIIFPDVLVHRHVAGAIAQTLRAQFDSMKVVSAGSVEGLDVEACVGESETLKLESREEDAQLINAHPYFHGIVM